jgi:hypothetical protein
VKQSAQYTQFYDCFNSTKSNFERTLVEGSGHARCRIHRQMARGRSCPHANRPRSVARWPTHRAGRTAVAPSGSTVRRRSRRSTTGHPPVHESQRVEAPAGADRYRWRTPIDRGRYGADRGWARTDLSAAGYSPSQPGRFDFSEAKTAERPSYRSHSICGRARLSSDLSEGKLVLASADLEHRAQLNAVAREAISFPTATQPRYYDCAENRTLRRSCV